MSGLPAVVHYTGHRIAGPGRQGLTARAESRVASAIAAHLQRLQVAEAYGSLASGADILFAEAFFAQKIPVHVWLPFGTRRFKTLSVRPAGNFWVRRFEQALGNAASVTILRGRGPAERSFAACAETAIRAALDAALSGRRPALQLAVWDGRAARGQAGTAIDVALWQSLGLPSLVVDPQPKARAQPPVPRGQKPENPAPVSTPPPRP